MSKRAKILLKRVAAGSLITSGLLLAGCGGGLGGASSSNGGTAQTSSTGTASVQQVAVTGAAVKGIISSAIVQAHQLETNSNGKVVVGPAIGQPTRTDSHGQFTLNLGGKASGWVIVELSADGQTRMTCDVTADCIDAQGATVAFGDQFPVSSQFKLDAALNLDSGTKVYLTPLSELAVSMAEKSSGGLTATNLSNAYAQVENIFGLKPGALQLAPPDLTKLDKSNASIDAIQLAVVNASFLAMVDGNQWQSVAQVIAAADSQIASNGTLAADRSAGEAFNVSAVESQAAVLAQALQQKVSNTLKQQSLAVSEMRSLTAYKTALEAAASTYSSSQSSSGSNTQTVANNNGSSPSSTNITNTGNGSPVAGAGSNNNVGPTTPTTTKRIATLDWKAPFTREDGSSLLPSELAGYIVYYGQSKNSLDHQVTINNAGTTNYPVTVPAAGTWYFAVKAVDTQGNESPLSNEVSKTF